MSDRDYSEERVTKRTRRRSPISPSPRKNRSRSPRPRSRSPYRSRVSPLSSASIYRRNKDGHREVTKPSSVLGIFGLAARTNENTLKDLFRQHARVKDVQLVMDKKTQKSRGFGFIYFDDIQSAIRAKEGVGSIELDGRCVRIDYSTTKRAHEPTPGVYMGDRLVGLNQRSSTYDRPPQRRHRKRSRSRSRSRSSSRRHRVPRQYRTPSKTRD